MKKSSQTLKYLFIFQLLRDKGCALAPKEKSVISVIKFNFKGRLAASERLVHI